MDYNSLTPQELAASGAGADYPVTDNYQLKYFNGDNFASFGVLTQDIIAIDAQMKKNEDGLQANTEEVTEINQNVQQLLTDVPKINDKAEQANQTASSAASDAHLAVQSANNAIQAASSASSQVTTLAGEVGEVQTAQETMQQDIQTNSNDISGLSTTIGTLNSSVTDVSNKMNTTVANVQKLSAGFDNNVGSVNTHKNITFLISKEGSEIYNIRVIIPSSITYKIIGFSAKAEIGSSISPSTNIANIPAFSYNSSYDSYGIPSFSIYRYGSGANLVLNYFGLYTQDLNFKVKKSEWDSVVSKELTEVVFEDTELWGCKLPSVQITNPTAASSTNNDNHNNPDIPYDGTSQGGIGKQEPVITP